MTIIVSRPTVEVERITYAEAFDAITWLIDNQGAPHPTGFSAQGYGVDPRIDYAGAILNLSFDSHAAVDEWATLLDFRPATSHIHHTDDHHEYEIRESHGRWHGWSTWLQARVYVPKPEFDGPDCAICGKPVRPGQEIVAGHKPMTVVHAACDDPTCRSCGGEMIHQIGCPDGPEHLADHYAADPPMLCTRCGDPLLPGQLIEQRTAGRVHVGCELGPQCVDCGVLGGGHQESCAFASRVDPEAAEKLPVLVFEVTPNPAPAPDIDDTIARLFDDDARLAVDELDDLPAVSVAQLAEAATVEPDARVYVPVPHPTGKQANAAECARLRGETSHHVPDVLPKRIPGAALAAEPVPPPSVVLTRNHPVPGLDEPTQQMPCASVPVNVELIHLAEHPVQAPVEAFHADRYDGAGSTS